MADSFIGGVLVWLKAFANWVLRLFDLAGSSGWNPLLSISKHWIVYLAVLLAVGTLTDLVVWLIRWRPYWIWTHQKRIIINDPEFFDRKKSAARRSGPGKGDELFDVPKQPTEKERRERIYAERLYDRAERPARGKAKKPARTSRRRSDTSSLFRTDDM